MFIVLFTLAVLLFAVSALASSDIEGKTIATAIIWMLMPILLPFIAIELYNKYREEKNQGEQNGKA